MIQALQLAPVCKRVQSLFDKIEQANGPLCEPVKTEHIMSALGDMVACETPPFKIKITRRNTGTLTGLAGNLNRYPNRAEINYADSYNRCWSRYIYFKELSHLLNDTADRHYTKDPIYLIQQLINGVDIDDEIVNSERMAYFASMEMLLPWKLRDKIQAMKESGRTEDDIAHAFRAPLKVVNFVMSGPYGIASAQANRVAAALTAD
jgi:hypothetical protein